MFLFILKLDFILITLLFILKVKNKLNLNIFLLYIINNNNNKAFLLNLLNINYILNKFIRFSLISLYNLKLNFFKKRLKLFNI